MTQARYRGIKEIDREIERLSRNLFYKEVTIRKILSEIEGADLEKAPKLTSKLRKKEKEFFKIRKDIAALEKLKEDKVKQRLMRKENGNLKTKKKLIENKELNKEISVQKNILQQLSSMNLELNKSEERKNKVGVDLFISHASEDKADFVKPLADALIGKGLNVWYDEYSLKIGDSLRQSIDKGLADAKYGLIVLSKSFFQKNWTNYELNGLQVKEMEGNKVILPIWHNITKDEIMKWSPSLLDKVALNTATLGVDEMAQQIANAVLDD